MILWRIETVGTPDRLGGRFYIAGGAWPGNDTIWRMVYDLNRILLFARPDGVMCPKPQRAYVAILDGLTAGEGNGPLQPIPVRAGVAAVSSDPFLMDMAMAALMGFDYRRIPLLANYSRFGGFLSPFVPASVAIVVDGRQVLGIDSVPAVGRFIPPPGWVDILRHEHYEIA